MLHSGQLTEQHSTVAVKSVFMTTALPRLGELLDQSQKDTKDSPQFLFSDQIRTRIRNRIEIGFEIGIG